MMTISMIWTIWTIWTISVRQMMETDRTLVLVLLLAGMGFVSRRNVPRTARTSRLASLRKSGQLHLEHGALSPEVLHRTPANLRQDSNSYRSIVADGSGQRFGKQWIRQRRAIGFLAAAITITFGVPWGVGVIVGWAGFNLVRKTRRQTHQRRVLAKGLVDLIDDMARQLRGGRGVGTGLLEAVANSSEELQEVMEPVVASLTIGTPPSRAVAALGARHNNPDLRSLATLLGAGEQLGGIRPDALDGLTVMMRERTTAGADVATQAAQARVSAIVLGCAPIVFCGLLVLSDGRSSAFLLHSPIGLGCAALGLTLDLCGAVWMSAVTRRATA
jgi:tight adherence protein B